MSMLEQPAQQLPITVGAASETGRREENQDYMTGFASAFGAVHLIADGMGGHRGGAVASRTAADAFSRHLLATPANCQPAEAIDNAIQQASAEVAMQGNSGDAALRGMGSTLVVTLIRSTGAGLVLQTAHVGDSRAYLYRDGQLKLLTKDHTQIQWMLDSKTIDEAAARNHPGASVLTRALGHTLDLHADVADPIPVFRGDRILLCSDGLSGFASSEQIHAAMQHHADAASCADALVQLAMQAGSDDNITVQVLRIGPQEEAVLTPPSRKTRPDGSSIPAGLQSAEALQRTGWTQRSTLMISLAVVLICAAVAAGVAFRHRHVRAVSPDSLLTARIRDFRSAATGLHSDASAAQAAARHIPATSTGGNSGTGGGKLSKSQLKDLQGKYASLSAQYDAIVIESDRLEQENRELEAEMDALAQRSRPAGAQAGTQAALDQLRQRVQTDEAALETCRKKLAETEGKRKDLDVRHA